MPKQAPLPLQDSLHTVTASFVGPEVGRQMLYLLAEISRLQREERIIDWDEVLDLTSLSRKTIQREMEDGRFPARVQLSESRSGWRSSEIRAWISTRPQATGYRSAERSEKAAPEM